jgi:hypothetical protein
MFKKATRHKGNKAQRQEVLCVSLCLRVFVVQKKSAIGFPNDERSVATGDQSIFLCRSPKRKKQSLYMTALKSYRRKAGLVCWLFPASSGLQPPSPKEKESGRLI